MHSRILAVRACFDCMYSHMFECSLSLCVFRNVFLIAYSFFPPFATLCLLLSTVSKWMLVKEIYTIFILPRHHNKFECGLFMCACSEPLYLISQCIHCVCVHNIYIVFLFAILSRMLCGWLNGCLEM